MLKDDVQPYLEELRLRQRTNREVARILGVNEAYLARVLGELNLIKIPSQTAREQAEIARRKELRAKRAQIAATMSVGEAARLSEVTERTIYRERAKCKS